MKKYLIIILSLLLLWGLEFFWMGRYSQRLSFEELTALPEISEGIELKRETYWCRIADRYDFSIIPHLPIQIPSNQKSVQTGDFSAYPLAELSRDLFVDKIIAEYEGQTWVVIEGRLQDQTCRFNRYQAKDHKRSQILDFLFALAHFDTPKAKNLIQSHGNLTPFRILDRCYAVQLFPEQESLKGKAICEDSGGPGVVDFELFVAGEMFYLYYNLDYEKGISWAETWMTFLLE